jgi:hypothetical protein
VATWRSFIARISPRSCVSGRNLHIRAQRRLPRAYDRRNFDALLFVPARRSPSSTQMCPAGRRTARRRRHRDSYRRIITRGFDRKLLRDRSTMVNGSAEPLVNSQWGQGLTFRRRRADPGVALTGHCRTPEGLSLAASRRGSYKGLRFTQRANTDHRRVVPCSRRLGLPCRDVEKGDARLEVSARDLGAARRTASRQVNENAYR